MRAMVLLPLLCAAVSAQTASFEGTAVNAANGEPLSGVHISLIAVSLSGIRDAYGAVSDAKGHFSVAGIPAGMYVFVAQRRGFIQIEDRKKGKLPIPTVTLKPGERVVDLKLQMTPRAVISGRVVDDFGDPVPNTDIHAEPISKDTAPIAVNIGPDDAHSDDHGEFRISGAPGKFRVRAVPPQHGDGAAAEIRTDGSSPVVYATTWYPNAVAPEQAATVEAAAGAEINGIEIHLAHRPRQERSPGMTVSGILRGLPDGTSAQQHAQVWLAQSAHGDFQNGRPEAVKSDGSFAIHLSRGNYRIWATYRDSHTYLQSDPVELAVSADIAGLQLNLQPAGDLTGTIEVGGERPGAPKPRRTVRFGEWSAETDRDGVFHLSAVRPGIYTVEIDALPEDSYIESTVLDGTVHDGVRLDLSHGVRGSTLKISVGAGGRISGAVANKDGTPAINALAIVTLQPVDPKMEPPPDNMARVDDAGNYSVHNLRPGKYRIAAHDFLQSFADNPDAIKNASEKGEEIEVKPGARLTKDLTLMEASDAKK